MQLIEHNITISHIDIKYVTIYCSVIGCIFSTTSGDQIKLVLIMLQTKKQLNTEFHFVGLPRRKRLPLDKCCINKIIMQMFTLNRSNINLQSTYYLKNKCILCVMFMLIRIWVVSHLCFYSQCLLLFILSLSVVFKKGPLKYV